MYEKQNKIEEFAPVLGQKPRTYTPDKTPRTKPPRQNPPDKKPRVKFFVLHLKKFSWFLKCNGYQYNLR